MNSALRSGTSAYWRGVVLAVVWACTLPPAHAEPGRERKAWISDTGATTCAQQCASNADRTPRRSGPVAGDGLASSRAHITVTAALLAWVMGVLAPLLHGGVRFMRMLYGAEQRRDHITRSRLPPSRTPGWPRTTVCAWSVLRLKRWRAC